MTKEDLKKMGISYIGSKLNENRFYVPLVGEVDLSEPYNWKSIFEIFYQKGYENGFIQGQTHKISEIKNVLNISDE